MKGNNTRVHMGYLYALMATAIWSGNFIVARGLSTSISPVSLAFWRWTVAVLVFLPLGLKPLLREWSQLRQHWAYLLVTSIFGITIFNTLIYIAGHTTTAINLSLISLTSPIFIMILARLFLREAITLAKSAGIVLVIIGMLLLLTDGQMSRLQTLSFSVGDGWMLLAALSFATYSLLLKRKPENLSIWSLQLSTFMLGLILLCPFYLWTSYSLPPVIWAPKTLLSIGYIGIFASLVAFTMWNQSIASIGPSKAGMLYYSLPLFSGTLAAVILGESIHITQIISALLIITGIIIANTSGKKWKSSDSTASENNQ